MTKAVLFSGTHPRHLFINKEVLKYFDEVLVVVMEREELLPDPPLDLVTRDKNLFMRHFENRLLVEQKAYGSTTDKEVFKNHQVYYTNPKTLNSKDLADKISDFDQFDSLIILQIMNLAKTKYKKQVDGRQVMKCKKISDIINLII